MDMDVECFQSTASFLRGFDVVLNVELGNKYTITNAVMASTPNATVWRRVFRMLRVSAALAPFLCLCAGRSAFAMPIATLQPSIVWLAASVWAQSGLSRQDVHGLLGHQGLCKNSA